MLHLSDPHPLHDFAGKTKQIRYGRGMDFERFLRQFLEVATITSWLATLGMALTSFGYIVVYGAGPLETEIGFFASLAIWIISRWALNLIFPAEPKAARSSPTAGS